MNKNRQDKVAAFDTLFTTNQIQMLKILLTYMEPSQQKTMAIYIKFMELQYTMTFFQRYPASSFPPLPRESTLNTSKLCDELVPLCNREEQEKLQNMKNMFQNMENMQEMLQTVQMMKDLFPEGEMPDMSGMDMSQMFEMFQGMNL